MNLPHFIEIVPRDYVAIGVASSILTGLLIKLFNRKPFLVETSLEDLWEDVYEAIAKKLTVYPDSYKIETRMRIDRSAEYLIIFCYGQTVYRYAVDPSQTIPHLIKDAVSKVNTELKNHGGLNS